MTFFSPAATSAALFQPSRRHPAAARWATLACLAIAPMAGAAPPVTLDDDFANHGVLLSMSSVAVDLHAIAHLPLPDGGSVAVFTYRHTTSTPCAAGQLCVGLARFGDQGHLIGAPLVGASVSFTFVQAATLDAQGRVVIVGAQKFGAGPDHDFLVGRVNLDGTPDASFGSGGLQTIAFDQGGGNYDAAHAVTIDGSGRIVVVGEAERSATNDSDYAIARLLPSGQLDASFGINSSGKRLITFNLSANSPTDVATGVAVDTSGRIVIAGTVRDTGIGLKRIGLVRLTSAGAMDTTWCQATCNWNEYPAVHSGRRVIFIGNPGEVRTHEVAALAVDQAGQVFVTGHSRLNGIEHGYAMRLAANGDWTAESQLDGGVSASASTVRMGGLHLVSPANASSDVVVTGVAGVIDEKLFFAQRLDNALAPRANWGSTGPLDSVAAFSATFGFLGDPGDPIPGGSSIDRYGRILMSGSVNVPTASDPYRAMMARLTHPVFVFRDGFE